MCFVCCQYICGGVCANLRSDGRARLDFRPFRVSVSPVPHANGSARVQLEGTDVLCAVNLSMVAPDWNSAIGSGGKIMNANRGIAVCNVESAPSATTDMDDRQVHTLNTQLTAYDTRKRYTRTHDLELRHEHDTSGTDESAPGAAL